MRGSRLLAVLGLGAIFGAAACSFGGDVDLDESANQVNASADVSRVLESTLVLETGCMAAKVGPRHLLLAARCVAGVDAFEAGNTIGFTLAKTAGTPGDAGAAARTTKVKIAAVDVHPSFLAKCEGKACGFDTLEASDAKDIAVITLAADLAAVATIPVDLDTVGVNDALLAVSSGCASFDAKASAAATTRTAAVPARVVNHEGSPYLPRPALVSRLGAGYVVTPGPAWSASDAKLCAANIGAPLFRGTIAAVAGVTSNFTAYATAPVPVTIHHTRVDVSSKVGPWLENLGVETVRSCSESTAGCTKRTYDGGTPREARDSGASADAATTTMGDGGTDDAGDAGENAPVVLPSMGESTQLSTGDDGESYPAGSSGTDEGEGDEARADELTRKKPAAASGCSAAPGSSDGFGALAGIALVLGALRRRRR